MKHKLLTDVTRGYLESRDFNGVAFSSLRKHFDCSEGDFIEALTQLVRDESIEIIFGDYHPNPHIKAFSNMDKSHQLKNLENAELRVQSCVYPSKKALHDHKDEVLRGFEGQPYSIELGLGAGQLDFRAFDLSVLEFYRDDPRYHYDCNDVHGKISVIHKHYESDAMPGSDKAFLQTFGFAYSDDFDRAVAVFLRYLADLTPEHQMIWKSKELQGKYKLHPDYYRNSILGDWGTRLSIFEAFTREQGIINDMCDRIGKPHLFRESFVQSRPREFAFLLRPTLFEFNQFVHLLDKIMSDNINKEFFRGDVDLEREETRSDGKVVVSQKGTVQLLEEWLRDHFKPADPEPITEMLSAFRRVRALRQKPAHAVKENEFDQKYFKEQRELVKHAYNAVRTLRLVLANHPAVEQNPPEIDDLLFRGMIWDI